MENKRIKNGDIFNLVNTSSNSGDCGACVFCNQGQCSLMNHDTNMSAEEENKMFEMCRISPNKHWEKVNKEEEDISHISSTGVVNPSTDAAPKEPSNDAPRVTKVDTKRTLTLELTLKEAREYYYSHNPILKYIACRLFTLDELEDVRRCIMYVDIKTAKRLYRNVEKTVRDFVLSAFSEEELKD